MSSLPHQRRMKGMPFVGIDGRAQPQGWLKMHAHSTLPFPHVLLNTGSRLPIFTFMLIRLQAVASGPQSRVAMGPKRCKNSASTVLSTCELSDTTSPTAAHSCHVHRQDHRGTSVIQRDPARGAVPLTYQYTSITIIPTTATAATTTTTVPSEADAFPPSSVWYAQPVVHTRIFSSKLDSLHHTPAAHQRSAP
jgi:hypothetical protein